MVRCKSRIGGAGLAGALALLVLAGCGGSSGKKPKPSTTPAKGTTAAGYLAGDVYFGVLAPTSGRHEQRGRDLVDGAKMAIAELNVRGGVNGHKAALVTYDDGCDAKLARRRAKALKGSDEVAGAVGGICESAASAAARTLSGVPFLVTSANAPSIVSAKRTPTAYLTNGTPYQSALATSHWFAYQQSERLAVVSEDDRASKFLGSQVLELASPAPRPVSQQAVPSGTKDWGTVVKAALDRDPDTVYWAGSAAGAAGFVSALRDAGYKGTFVASAEADSPEFLAAAGPAAEGAFVIAPATPQNLPRAVKWTKEFQAKFKHDPGFDALQAYEGVRALAQAVTQSGKVDRERNSEEIAVPDGSYRTLLGDAGLAFAVDHTIKFDNNIALKVDGGRFVVDNTLRSDEG